MLNVALEYRKVIDTITANKSLKMRQYELDDEGWDIIKDLLRVLKVNFSFIVDIFNHCFRCIRRPHSSFPKMP
jgi:hypothetical protein